MGNLAVSVGLDYSDAFVRVCVVDPLGGELGNRECANDWSAIAAYVGTFGVPVRAAIEAGTGAANLAEELMCRAGWSVHLAHPGFVNRMKQNPDKSDCQDAFLLADLVRVGYLPRVWLPPEPIRDLRRLVRYRQQLVSQRRHAKQRIRALVRDARQKPRQGVNPWTKAWWLWLENVAQLSEQTRWLVEQQRLEIVYRSQLIQQVEQRLTQVTAEDPVVQKLLQIRGVGPVTAWTLRAEVGQFDRFTSGKQLARFGGVTPCNASSGQRQADAGVIKAANPQLRAVLVETAHRLGRWEPRWVQFKERLKKRGKPGSVIAAAIANRWMRWLYHQMVPAA